MSIAPVVAQRLLRVDATSGVQRQQPAEQVEADVREALAVRRVCWKFLAQPVDLVQRR